MNFEGKTILILGGSGMHCKLVEAAKDMGIYTIVTDYLNEDNSPAKRIADKSYQINITDIDTIVDMCKKNRVGAVLATHLDPCQRPYYEICKRLDLPCYIDTLEQVTALTDKNMFKRLCVNNNVDIIQTYNENMPNDIRYPVLVKPVDSRGSRGQTICHNITELYCALDLAHRESSNDKAIIEQYMGNTGDFTVTYIFADGEPYLERIADRYLGKIESGMEKVGVGTVAPSKYTKMYFVNVESKVLNMLRSLGIKNGPVFMQGFVDGDTVRMYDPGFRFPGCEYETAMQNILGIDVIKMMIEFAFTGKMKNEYFALDKNMALLNGHKTIALYPTSTAGKILKIQGVKEILSQCWVRGYSVRYCVGDVVNYSRDVSQQFAEFDILAKDINTLVERIKFVQEKFHVYDEFGNEMLFEQFDTDLLKG